MSGRSIAVSAGTAEVLRHSPLSPQALTPAEAERARAFQRPEDRDDFVAAHLLVRLAAARVLGVPADRVTLRQHCADCGGPHGKPSVEGHPEVSVSLSHAPGLVAAAAGRDPVGVDIERLGGPPVPLQAMALVLSEPEMRDVLAADACRQRVFFRLWVRKECLVKIGSARLQTMRDTDVSAAADGGAFARSGYFLDWEGVEPDHVAAAVGTTRPVRVGLTDLLRDGGRERVAAGAGAGNRGRR